MSECALTTRVFSAAQRAQDFNMRRGWLGEVAEHTSAGVRHHALDMTAAATEQSLNTRKGWLSITADRCGAACKAYGNAYTSTKPEQDRKGWLENRLRHAACFCSAPFLDSCSFQCEIGFQAAGILPCADGVNPPCFGSVPFVACALDVLQAAPVNLLWFSGSCGWFKAAFPDCQSNYPDTLSLHVHLLPARTLCIQVFYEYWNIVSIQKTRLFYHVSENHWPAGQCPSLDDLYGTYQNQQSDPTWCEATGLPDCEHGLWPCANAFAGQVVLSKPSP